MAENTVLQSLRMLNCGIRRRYERSELKREVDNLTGMHSWVIGYLIEHDGEDVFQRDIESALGLSRSGTSKLLAQMEQKGMVTRIRVASDDRLKKIVLTERARVFSERIREDLVYTERQLTEGFSEEELSQLCSYLDRMQQNLDQASGSGKENV